LILQVQEKKNSMVCIYSYLFNFKIIIDYFIDISLNVRDCKNIYESFNQYTEEELMEGENKYMAEGRGLQNAKKGIRFISFPSVLFLQLKRFEYDYDRDVMAKVYIVI